MKAKLNDAESTMLRFDLAAQLLRMPYGTGHLIDGDTAAMAWPPTGDHDRSIEGAFRAMALASAGNRPEESYTTIERIKKDLDESFLITEEWNGDYSVVRLLYHCPRCRGSGQFRMHLPEKFVPVAFDAEIPMTAKIKTETVECDHLPVS